MSQISSQRISLGERAHVPLSGVPWFLFVIGMWLMFVVSAIFFADTLDDVWSWVRGLPLLLEAVLWLALLPWLLGLAVWESSWQEWLRVSIVALCAIGWTAISIPRRKPRNK